MAREYGAGSGGGPRDYWDSRLNYLQVGVEHKRFRLIGGPQKIGIHWIIPKAADFAEELRKYESSKKKGKKPPRKPSGFPSHSPAFSLWDGRVVDLLCPETGMGFRTGKGTDLNTAKRMRLKGLSKRYSREPSFNPVIAKKSGRAVQLVPVYDALLRDFDTYPGIRTYWYAIDRELQALSKNDVSCVGIIGKGGFPPSLMKKIDNIAKAKGDPSHPVTGYDIIITKDTNQKGAGMWDAMYDDRTKLKKRELAFFGKHTYNNKSINYRDLLKLQESDDFDADKLFVVEEGILIDVAECALPHIPTPQEFGEKLANCGYYDDAGKPNQYLAYRSDGKAPKKATRGVFVSPEDRQDAVKRRAKPADFREYDEDNDTDVEGSDSVEWEEPKKPRSKKGKKKTAKEKKPAPAPEKPAVPKKRKAKKGAKPEESPSTPAKKVAKPKKRTKPAESPAVPSKKVAKPKKRSKSKEGVESPSTPSKKAAKPAVKTKKTVKPAKTAKPVKTTKPKKPAKTETSTKPAKKKGKKKKA